MKKAVVVLVLLALIGFFVFRKKSYPEISEANYNVRTFTYYFTVNGIPKTLASGQSLPIGNGYAIEAPAIGGGGWVNLVLKKDGAIVEWISTKMI